MNVGCCHVCLMYRSRDPPPSHRNHTQGLRLALLKAWAALVELYHSDLWVRWQRVLNNSSGGKPPAAEPPSQAPTGTGGFFMGGAGGGCAARRPERAEEGGGLDGDAMPSSLFDSGFGEEDGGGSVWGEE